MEEVLGRGRYRSPENAHADEVIVADSAAACVPLLQHMKSKEEAMHEEHKRLVDFLLNLGIEKIDHTGKTYLAHLVNVYRLMHRQGCSAELCRAGMFHSLYGTERFQGFTIPLARRTEIRGLIGERAERLAYLNCAMDRAVFDEAVRQGREPFLYRDRITGEQITLPREDFDDLCRVHLFDWLEQVPRSRFGWGYRREAYRAMAERLGGAALETYDHIFASETRE